MYLSGSPALEVRDLTRRYGDLVAVDNLSLTVSPGDIYGFLGPNGAGKTTAMRCMVGLIRRDSGQVKIFGDSNLNHGRRHLGAIIEIPAFHLWSTARNNLRWSCAYADIPRSRWNVEIDRVIERVGLKGRELDRVRTYSLGMKQRLGIARALLGSPKLLMLDEPTNGLDPRGMREVKDLIKSLAMHDNITVLISSHLLAEIQMMATRVGIIQKGKLRAEGVLQDLLLQQQGKNQVQVQSSDMAALRSALDRVEGVSYDPEAAQEDETLLVTCAKMQVHVLNKVLVERGVPVGALIPVKSSLEDVFLEVTS
ncbi:MAG: ABC-type multidrug transport system ATPase subunit [Kiritimatiellia bacterium]|jgi:ABC-type multidrug transport system ATPase subunit